ncbi:MAG TPA: hypothetical protein VK760_07265 [Candidatus Acidoferrales bacterium]|jgi:hypothetical protein|nr:hypothetical protein [Candidatus Acidoferrales bacterium]
MRQASSALARLGPAMLLTVLAACAPARPPAAPVPAPGDVRYATAALRSEIPVQADAFVDSIGVNTHLIDDLTYDKGYAVVTQRMRELGVRHIRDGIFPGQTPRQYADERNFLRATGAQMEAITDCPKPLGYFPHAQTPPSLIRSFDAAIGGRIERLEGPNEPDLRKVHLWGQLLTHCMEHFRFKDALPVPFVASAMGNAFNTRKLGDISKLVDIGAIHRYFSGFNPETTGFWKSNACGTWGAMSFYICEARINAGPAAPLYITETGYTTFGEVDEKTAGKYISRVLLFDSLAGIVRTYIYELHDDGTDTTNSEDGYGLFRYDGTPKPAFNAVRSEIALLSDPGPSFSPAPLAYSVYGVKNLRHELFQKRDGTYVLAVWNESKSWNPSEAREMVVPVSVVTVTFAAAPQSVRFSALDDGGRLVKQHPGVRGNVVTANVDDHVAFLAFNIKKS